MARANSKKTERVGGFLRILNNFQMQFELLLNLLVTLLSAAVEKFSEETDTVFHL